MRLDAFPVEWTGRLAVVAFPGHVGVSNVDQLRDRLLAVINRGAAAWPRRWTSWTTRSSRSGTTP